ncbi:hypothetical protein BJF79_43640 [Actinomadura sp. CNU-125]|uniref:sialidase family protein n=1 Tax=Actinomadura sp. CNU-125 TaxID=1904961 RepID=UPI0009610D0E|nr:sialidase family protein [Actinomadura sp. CNU-125]OLT26333.1 hypothetical protein BJF79_43640 [Actinomadura sp. CNU-125]
MVVSHDITAFWDDKPSITAHPRRPGVVYAVWNRRNMTSGEHETMLAVSTDGARSWGEERVVHRSDWPEQGALGNQIVVLPGGTLLNVFLENEFPIGGPPWPTENRDERLRVIRSSDGGENWSEPVTISTHKLNDPVLPDDGRAVSANGILPEIAVDPRTGFVHVVWAENGLSESASAIGMSSSPDGGRTWSEPRRVDRTPESGRGGNGQAILPQVDVAPNGTIAITYYDFRENTPEAGTPTSLWMTTCRGWWCAWTSHGWRERKLAGPFDLEKATTWDGQPLLGGYYGLANTGSSFVSAFVATSDDPENKQDVYFTRTPASPGR